MILRHRSISLLAAVLLLLSLLDLSYAATPTSFCKCTCFKQSYIIPLDAPNSQIGIPGSGGGHSNVGTGSRNRVRQTRNDLTELGLRRGDTVLAKTVPRESETKTETESKVPEDGYKSKTCSDCNKQFCLGQNLPICKGATDEDVTTSCFQRDSSKDEAVVFIFIVATVSLLGWALVRPLAKKWMDRAREQRSYAPINGE